MAGRPGLVLPYLGSPLGTLEFAVLEHGVDHDVGLGYLGRQELIDGLHLLFLHHPHLQFAEVILERSGVGRDDLVDLHYLVDGVAVDIALGLVLAAFIVGRLERKRDLPFLEVLDSQVVLRSISKYADPVFGSAIWPPFVLEARSSE